MIVTVYGIKNCSTVKKALDWLDHHAIAYQFHDYKRVGVDEKQLAAWCAELGWERVLNRAGTTFRALPEADRQNLDRGKAIRLMAAQPSMIKRPIVDLGSRRLLGFSAELYQQNLL